MSNAQTIADLLQARRIDWRRIEALGGDPRQIMVEAGQHGDRELVKRARRRIERAG